MEKQTRPAKANEDPQIYEHERMQDPLNDRVVKEVPRPPSVALSVDRVFPLMKNGERHPIPNLPLIREYLKQFGRVSKPLIMNLISKAKQIFNLEPNLLRVNGPTHIFGDIHGQFFDLVPLLDTLPSPE